MTPNSFNLSELLKLTGKLTCLLTATPCTRNGVKEQFVMLWLFHARPS